MTSHASSGTPPEPAGPDQRPVLVLNACEERLQIVLGRQGALLLHQEWAVPGRAMGVLGPALKQGLELLGIRPGDLAGVACVRGPGSFTGIRIVLSTALGLMDGCGVPLAGLDYLPLLARSAAPFAPLASLGHGSLVVLTYARRGLSYVQGFDLPSREPLSELCVCRPEQAVELAASLPGPRFCLGSALRRDAGPTGPAGLTGLAGLAELLTGKGCEILPPQLDHPTAWALLAAALEAPCAASAVEPLYVRPSDAEENLPEIARQRGMSPAEARRALSDAFADQHSPR